MSMIKIVLRGDTVPAGRPRFTRTGIAYQPQKTRQFQHDLKLRAQDAMEGKPLLSGPLDVTVSVELPMPKTFNFKKRSLATTGWLHPITRPDLDNYIKQLDALNNVVWLDDSQIVRLHAAKVYSERPGIVIEIEEVPHQQKVKQAPLFDKEKAVEETEL